MRARSLRARLFNVTELVVVGVVVGVLLTVLVLRRRSGGRKKFDVSYLAERLGISEQEVRELKPSYASRAIDKRGPYRSNSEKRELLIPDPNTMEMQRRILKRILASLSVHPSVTGFEKGSSVAVNAAAHTNQSVVIKMDLVSFFPKTRTDRVGAYFRSIGWSDDAAEVLTRLTTHEGGLPQGAPTSPALSNRINFALDHAIARHVQVRQGVYTRYADDITVSFSIDRPYLVRSVVHHVGRVAKRYGYEIHQKRKFRVLRRHHSQRVTGLVVNDGPQLPRETRRWLRAVEHRMKTTKSATLTKEQLQGWKAYQAHVENIRANYLAKEKAELVQALSKNGRSLRNAAAELRIPGSVLRRRLKRHGLWKPDSTS